MTNAEFLTKIREEIKRRIRESNHDTNVGVIESSIVSKTLHSFSDFLFTLESEKPMNQEELEKEIENTWEKLEKDYSPAALDKTTIIVSGLVGEKQFSKIAHYFYDLGCRRTAEKYDEIEYNRQRAEESEKPMNLEGEINRYLREECSDDDEPSIHEIAEHFAQWGAEHLKK